MGSKSYTINESNKTIEWDDEDEGISFSLPARYEVCDRCEGEGTHIADGIDSHGITREEFDADPDFEEAYFSGRYDVPCTECGGKRVVLCVNRAFANSEVLAIFDAMVEEDYRFDAICESERRFGC